MAKLGDKRIYRGFAIFPKTVENKRIWWKSYYSIYEYRETSRIVSNGLVTTGMPVNLKNEKYNQWEHVKNILHNKDNIRE